MAVLSFSEILRMELGNRYEDLRASLPQNPNGPNGAFGVRSIRGITTIAVHHSAGPSAQTWRQVADYHVNSPTHRWAGIGYHVGIRDGVVSYLGDVGESRACCANQNDAVVCVCVMGNFETSAVGSADRLALERVVVAIQRWAKQSVGHTLAVRGHKEVPGQQTACPGKHMMPIVHALAANPAVPSGPVDVGPGRNAIMQAAVAAQRININTVSALLRAITADGFVPVSNEIGIGDDYVAQLAQHPKSTAKRAYFVKRGDWGSVGHYE